MSSLAASVGPAIVFAFLLIVAPLLAVTESPRSGAVQTTVLQTAQKPSFDVASIKRTTDVNAERGGGFIAGGRFVMTNVDVRTLGREREGT